MKHTASELGMGEGKLAREQEVTGICKWKRKGQGEYKSSTNKRALAM